MLANGRWDLIRRLKGLKEKYKQHISVFTRYHVSVSDKAEPERPKKLLAIGS